MKTTLAGCILILTLGLIGTPALPAQRPDTPAADPSSERAEDPVCHLSVLKNPELSVSHRGVAYYFCMKADMEAFRKDPEKYLRGQGHSHPNPSG